MLNEVGVRENNREFKQLRRRPQRQLQKTIYFMSKTTALLVHHAFCTFLWLPLHDNDKTLRLMRRFIEDEEKTTTNSPFSFWTSIKFLIIQLQEKSPAFHILRGFKYTRLSLKERKFIFQRRFHCQSSSSLPKLPNVPMTGYADLLCLSHLLCSIDNKHSLLKDVITRVMLKEHQRTWTNKLITIEKTVFYFFEVHSRSFYRLHITNCLTSSPG